MNKIRLYLARGMTGRIKEEVVAEAVSDKEFLEKAGFTVLCPVMEEGVESTKQVLRSSRQLMETYWPRDKAMIREAHIVLDMTPHLNSEGVKHEVGYARYNLWKPVVRVFPTGKLPIKSSVSHFEDDAVVDSIVEAVEYILRVHGTRWKRLKWRMKMLNKSLPKWIYYQLQELLK